MLKIIQSIEPWSFLIGMITGVVIVLGAIIVNIVFMEPQPGVELDDHEHKIS